MSKLYQEEVKYNLDSFYDQMIKEKFEDWMECKPYTKKNFELVIHPMLDPEHKFSYKEFRDNLKGLVFAVRK
jgi:hypothetical protein